MCVSPMPEIIGQRIPSLHLGVHAINIIGNGQAQGKTHTQRERKVEHVKIAHQLTNKIAVSCMTWQQRVGVEQQELNNQHINS